MINKEWISGNIHGHVLQKGVGWEGREGEGCSETIKQLPLRVAVEGRDLERWDCGDQQSQTK